MNQKIDIILFWFIVIFCFHTPHSLAQDQQNLHREIRFENSGGKNIREALDLIASENGFYFSYQSSSIEANQPLLLNSYQGSIAGFLERTFGSRYEFKEIHGYIIIRYAPGKLDLDAELETDPKQTVIKGYVKDFYTRENIAYASIYNRNNLETAMSDREGYFELKLRQSNPILTLSKDNYKDTTFMILPVVDIQARKAPNRFRFYPENGTGEVLEQSFFGRMFIGFRQRFQRINLGGFFAESPFQMSLTPGLSSKGIFSSQMINNFSLNLLGGYTAGVDGFEAAGIVNINQWDVQYFQMAGIMNLVGGNLKGFQAAGIMNRVYKDVYGFQVAGLHNRTEGNFKGLQVAGIYNLVDSIASNQIAGLMNQSREARGFQIAGLVNRTNNHYAGWQIAGLMNYSNSSANHQLAGLVNRAKNVKGIQFSGLLNIAESSDYPIGFVNLIKNGQKSLAFGVDESAFSQLTFRSGGKKLYGLLGIAYPIWLRNVRFALEAGFGYHMLENKTYSLDLEMAYRNASDFKRLSHHTNSLKLLSGFLLNNHTKLFAGPTLNLSVLDPDEDLSIPGLVFYSLRNRYGTYGVYAGFTVGLQYVF